MHTVLHRKDDLCDLWVAGLETLEIYADSLEDRNDAARSWHASVVQVAQQGNAGLNS